MGKARSGRGEPQPCLAGLAEHKDAFSLARAVQGIAHKGGPCLRQQYQKQKKRADAAGGLKNLLRGIGFYRGFRGRAGGSRGGALPVSGFARP